MSSLEADVKKRWGYSEWSLQNLCGRTPAFPWAATRVKVQCLDLSKEDLAAWWRVSLQVLEQMTRLHAPMKPWLHCTQKHEESELGSLLQMGWLTLQDGIKCPNYPSKLELIEVDQSIAGGNSGEAGHVQHLVFHIGCPYGEFVRHALALLEKWLSWSHMTWKLGRLELSRTQLDRWCVDFDKLHTLLPEPALISMHNDLWQKGIYWEWLGEDRTRIGEGVLQQVVSGTATDLPLSDPQAWHVPIYTITGSVGKTTTARLLWQLLQPSTNALALAASDGAWIGKRRVANGDCIGGVTARALLQSRDVDAAVFEQGRGGIIKQGVPYVRSDVAILLNVQPVHLGLDGIETLEQMADTKAVGLHPARLWVLNHDDEQCRRLAAQHPVDATLWFSVSEPCVNLRKLSKNALAAVGVERDSKGKPQAITVLQAGQTIERWPLEGVAPYHGLLGDKSLEELLAVVAAAYFGPIKLSGEGWAQRLRLLKLDSENHVFRTSVHRQGRALFVLDKAAELASLNLLQWAVDELALSEGCEYRIVALCRSAGELPERHLESLKPLHGFMDEFLCFDRPDTYTTKVALPIYTPGSIPVLLHNELMRLNADSGLLKTVVVFDDWTHVEIYLRQRLGELPGKTMVLINQPSTASTALNQQILTFATTGLDILSADKEADTKAHD